MLTYAKLGAAGIPRMLDKQDPGRTWRKAEYHRRMLVMTERFGPLVHARIAEVYAKPTMQRELQKHVNVGANVMLRAVRELAFVYQRPPTRTLDLDDFPEGLGKALNDRLAKVNEQSRINARGKAWGRYAFAMNVCWVVPGVWRRRGELVLDYTLVLPHVADRIWSEHPSQTDILLWKRDKGWLAVDAEAYWWLDERYQPQRAVAHGLGVCPAVEFRVSEPPAGGDYYDIGRGHRLLTSSVECGRIGAAQTFVRRSQNRRLVTAFGDIKNMDRDQVASPSAAITGEGTAKSIQFDVHDFETSIQFFAEEAAWHVEQAIETYGIPITALSSTKTDESRNAQMHATRAAVREDQLEFVRPAELELAWKSHGLMARFGHPLSINPELVRERARSKWGPLSFVDTPMQQLSVWERKLAAGLMSPAQACQELHPWMTEAQALAFILRNLEQKAQIDLFYARHNVGALLLSQVGNRLNPGETLPQMQGRLGGQIAAQAA